MRFRPRARLISMLGSELIGDPVTGVLELVKNGYDADATMVQVQLLQMGDLASGTISILDDGTGMTWDDLETKWLSPAVEHKERDKRARRRTPRGRLPIGEKGVGRLAVHRLGRLLQLVTRTAGGPELVMDIDWDEFDASMYLDQIGVSVREREPEVFTGNATGTLLTVSALRERWNSLHVRALQRGLRRLQSPLTQWPDFTVSLLCPEHPQYEGLDNSDILKRFHYSLRGHIDAAGVFDFRYECRLPELARVPERVHSDDAYDLAARARQRGELGADPPACGAFDLTVYVWDRTAAFLKAVNVSRDNLDDYSGVALFRDGLRVLPYGEQGDDWLALDREKINDPSRRFANNQVIGYVEVTQEDSPDLRDKTNREGLIDNAAFRDLRTLVRAAMDVFASEWYQDRPRGEPDTPTVRPSAGAKPNPQLGGEASGNGSAGDSSIAVRRVKGAAESPGQYELMNGATVAPADTLTALRALEGLAPPGLVSALRSLAHQVGLPAVPAGEYTLVVARDGTTRLKLSLVAPDGANGTPAGAT